LSNLNFKFQKKYNFRQDFDTPNDFSQKSVAAQAMQPHLHLKLFRVLKFCLNLSNFKFLTTLCSRTGHAADQPGPRPRMPLGQAHRSHRCYNNSVISFFSPIQFYAITTACLFCLNCSRQQHVKVKHQLRQRQETAGLLFSEVRTLNQAWLLVSSSNHYSEFKVNSEPSMTKSCVVFKCLQLFVFRW
jgi:hypothetical protein